MRVTSIRFVDSAVSRRQSRVTRVALRVKPVKRVDERSVRAFPLILSMTHGERKKLDSVTCLSVCLPVRQSASQSVSLSVCLSVCLPACLTIYIYVSIYLSLALSK